MAKFVDYNFIKNMWIFFKFLCVKCDVKKGMIFSGYSRHSPASIQPVVFYYLDFNLFFHFLSSFLCFVNINITLIISIVKHIFMVLAENSLTMRNHYKCFFSQGYSGD